MFYEEQEWEVNVNRIRKKVNDWIDNHRKEQAEKAKYFNNDYKLYKILNSVMRSMKGQIFISSILGFIIMAGINSSTGGIYHGPVVDVVSIFLFGIINLLSFLMISTTIMGVFISMSSGQSYAKSTVKSFIRRNCTSHVLRVPDDDSRFTFLWSLSLFGDKDELEAVSNDFNNEVRHDKIVLTGSLDSPNKDNENFPPGFSIQTKLIWNGEGELDMNEAVAIMRKHSTALSKFDRLDSYVPQLDNMPESIDLMHEEPYNDIVKNISECNIILGSIRDRSNFLDSERIEWCGEWCSELTDKINALAHEARTIHDTLGKDLYSDDYLLRLGHLEAVSKEYLTDAQKVLDTLNDITPESLKSMRTSTTRLTTALHDLRDQQSASTL
jgi:hypothetical protein